VGVLGFVSRHTEGYSVDFTGELVRQYGVRGVLRFGQQANSAWKRLVNDFGEEDAHLLAAFSSLWNGCLYCAEGHLLAHNLHVFHDGQRLFPLDEHELRELVRLRDAEILDLLRARLGAHAKKLALVLRQHALKNAVEAPSPPEPALDVRLRHAITLYDWINECSIMTEAEPPPLGPIAKNKALLASYRQARARSAGALAPAAPAVAAPG
jgi:hypothetical protein